MLVCRDIVAHKCGNFFCEQCWRKWQKECPSCRQAGDVAPQYADRRSILNFVAICPHPGCKVTYRLGNREDHVSICPRRPLPCPNCLEPIPVDFIKGHQETSCKKRRIPCKLCSKLVPSEDMSEHLHSNSLSGLHVNFLMRQLEVANAKIEMLMMEKTGLSLDGPFEALYDYVPGDRHEQEEKHCISMRKGDILIRNIKKSNSNKGWTYIYLAGKEGFVPSNRVGPLSPTR